MAQGTTNPCHFIEKGCAIRGLVYGDDFLFTGRQKDLQWLSEVFAKEYHCKMDTIGLLNGYKRSARFLNRVITFAPTGIELEADQRLVEVIIHGTLTVFTIIIFTRLV